MKLNVKMFVELPALIKKSSDQTDTEFIKQNISVNPIKVSSVRSDITNKEITYVDIDGSVIIINLPYIETMQKINSGIIIE